MSAAPGDTFATAYGTGGYTAPSPTPSFWSSMLPSGGELQMAAAAATAYLVLEALPCADWLARTLPSIIDQVPHADLVLKALLLASAVVLVHRMVTGANSCRQASAVPISDAYGWNQGSHASGMHSGMPTALYQAAGPALP